MRPLTKTVVFEWRKPCSKMEKSCWGVTTSNDATHSRIWIRDTAYGRQIGVDTFFHEMVHVYFNFFPNRRLSSSSEEVLAQSVGRAVRGLICFFRK